MLGDAPAARAGLRRLAKIACVGVAALLASLSPSRQARGDPRLPPALRALLAAPRKQRVSDALYLRLLREPGIAERALKAGRFIREGGGYWGEPIVRRKPTEPAVMFHLRIATAELPRLDVFFKPQQQGYRDWVTEVAVCRLARHLGVRVAPCSEREVPRAVLAAALATVPERYRRRLRWDGASGGRIYGFFRVWAPDYAPTLGALEPTTENLLAVARLLQPRHRRLVQQHPILQHLSDLIALDYLVYNNDRRNNLGTIRGPHGPELFPIDFGDGLSVSPRRKVFCKRWFAHTTLFRERLVRRIRELDARKLEALLTHPVRGLLVERYHIKWVMLQRQRLLDHVERLVSRHGKQALF